MEMKRGFASDNNSGIHPEILEAIERANHGHCVAYGDDPFTASAVGRFKEVFGDGVEVFFVFTGTGANVLALKAVCASHESILTADTSHLNVDECGAPEHYIGAKIVSVPTEDGKLSPRDLEPLLDVRGDPHHSQPRAISVSQATELGTVYTKAEIEELADFARSNGLLLHMDGARVANAAVRLGCGLREATRDAGVDVLSFGGTKNGMMIGESVLIFNPKLADHFKYIRKQGMQLASKMRFLSAQFEAYLSDDLWMRSARHANEMARFLAEGLRSVPGCRVMHEVDANAVFASVPRRIVEDLRKEYFFYAYLRYHRPLDAESTLIRLMTSFDTDEKDVGGFLQALRKLLR